jgi:hypothetical protein
MNAPQYGRRRCCALAALMAGALLLTLSGRSAEASQQKDLLNNLLGTIDDTVNLYAQALQQGNGAAAGEADRALQDLMQALQQAEGMKHHHHRHHKGGAFGQGVDQAAGGAASDPQQPQDLLPPFDPGTSQGTVQGKGSFGKGMNMGGRKEEKHHHHHKSSFGSGMKQAGQWHHGSPMSKFSGEAALSSGKVINNAPGGSINNGISKVTTNIRNVFNGPTNFNINNGQQTLTQNAKASTTPSTTGKSGTGASVGTKNTPAATQTADSKRSHRSDGSKASISPAVTVKDAGTTVRSQRTATGNGSAKTAKTSTASAGVAKTSTASASGKGKSKLTMATSAGSAVGSKSTGTLAAKNLTPRTTNMLGAHAAKSTPHQQLAQVGKATGSGMAKKGGTSMNFAATNRAMAPRNIGASVGSRAPVAFRAPAVSGKRK